MNIILIFCNEQYYSKILKYLQYSIDQLTVLQIKYIVNKIFYYDVKLKI